MDGLDVGSVSKSPTHRASMDLCCRRTSSDQGRRTAAQLSSTGLREWFGSIVLTDSILLTASRGASHAVLLIEALPRRRAR
eukprot:7043202-Prymnesium_polylepis.1